MCSECYIFHRFSYYTIYGKSYVQVRRRLDMSDHPFENTYDLSNEQLLLLDEAEEEMLRNNLGKAEEILLQMLDDDYK